MKLFEKNVGWADKAIRIVAGIALVAAILAGYVTAPLSYLAGLVGLALLATGLMGTCALYSLLGINTAKKQK